MTTYLITGGAGSLGVSLVNELQKDKSNKIRVLDNCEHALATMKIPYPALIRKLYGDITDKDRVRRAVHGTDVVIHCAALKNLEISEYNPSELIKTNVLGTDNVISAAADAGVSKVMLISSDKAIEPTSIYGASKLLSEHIALNYNQTNYPQSKVSVFRSGNFTKSNGNVFEIWKAQSELGLPLTITDMKCRRFFINTDIVAKTILRCISSMSGGEIYIPDGSIMPEKSIIAMAKEFADEHDFNLLVTITGLRKGEKMFETLFSSEESQIKKHNIDLDCFVISRE